MKKVLTILTLLSVMIFSTLSVFAAEVSVQNVFVEGKWEFNDTFIPPSSDWQHRGQYSAGDYYEVFSTKVYYNGTGFRRVFVNADGSELLFYLNSTGNSSYITVTAAKGWVEDASLDFGAGVHVSEGFYNWLTANAQKSKNECDGSSCPVTDVNHDNICDVCGKVLTLSLRSTLLDYAHAVIDNGKSIFPNTNYWLVTEDPPSDGYRIFMSTEPFTYNPNTGNLISNGIVQRTTVSQEDDGSFTGGTSWASKQPTSYTSLDYGRPVDTSHDIEHFFPVTLWMEMTQVTETEMENLQGETVGTMKVLVACGVGLIALLVVLKLFGKRSLIFRD